MQIGTGRRIGALYHLIFLHLPTSSPSTALATSVTPFELWHSQLGHLSLSKMKLLCSSGSLQNIKIV